MTEEWQQIEYRIRQPKIYTSRNQIIYKFSKIPHINKKFSTDEEKLRISAFNAEVRANMRILYESIVDDLDLL